MHWFILVKSQESRNHDFFELSLPGSKTNPLGHNDGRGGAGGICVGMGGRVRRGGGGSRWDEVVIGFNDAAFVGSGGFSKVTWTMSCSFDGSWGS